MTRSGAVAITVSTIINVCQNKIYMNIDRIECMVALLGIIITLSIAYNFWNIWKFDKKIKSLIRKVNSTIKDLETKIIKNELNAELIIKDNNVSDDYRSEKWLQGLKHEFEIVAFLCNNLTYFAADFQGKIGIKRSSIAAILLNINGFDNTSLLKYNKNTLDDIYITVVMMWGNIKSSDSYQTVQKYEGACYEELFQITETLLKQIRDRNIPIILPEGVIEKLNYYKSKYGS